MKYKKRILIILAFIFVFIHPGKIVAYGETEAEVLEPETNVLDQTSLEDIQQYWDMLTDEYRGYLPELEKTSLYEFIKSNDKVTINSVLNGLMKFLFHEIILNGKLLGMLLMLTILSSLLQTMHHAFEKSAISKIAYFVVYIVLLFLALNSFQSAFNYAKDAIAIMSGFMMALLPLLLGLMATFGNLITVSFFHPVVIFLIHFSGILVGNFIMPLLLLSALLLIVSSLNDNIQVTHLANLMKTVGLGTLGAFFTAFLGVLSIQGTASAIQDGIAVKTTKFITGNFIPVVGRAFTDAADTILSASLLLKNAIGIVGVLIIALLALFPVIKIAAIALIYKVAAAVLQPLGDGPIIESLNIISKYMVYIIACLLAVTLMFFLAVVIIVIASNVTLLTR